MKPNASRERKPALRHRLRQRQRIALTLAAMAFAAAGILVFQLTRPIQTRAGADDSRPDSPLPVSFHVSRVLQDTASASRTGPAYKTAVPLQAAGTRP